MKTIIKFPVTIRLLILISIISTGVSCNDKNDKKDQKVQIENDESFAGSSKRDDICQLLTKDDIRSVFDLPDAMELKQKEDKNAICSYTWNAPGEDYM